jgi:hypothetical protein
MSIDQPNNPKDDFTRVRPPAPKIPDARPNEEFPQMFPICPYCGTDPATIASTPFQLGPLTFLALFCSTRMCRKILALQVVGAQEPPRIVMPNSPRPN